MEYTDNVRFVQQKGGKQRMSRRKITTPVQDVLERVEALPDDDQTLVGEVLWKRSIAARRRRLAKDIAETRAAYRRGAVSRGGPADVMRDLDR